MPKFSKQMIELQAWQEFELEYLIEPEPPLDPSYARIIEDDDFLDIYDDFYNDGTEYIDLGEFGDCYDD